LSEEGFNKELRESKDKHNYEMNSENKVLLLFDAYLSRASAKAEFEQWK